MSNIIFTLITLALIALAVGHNNKRAKLQEALRHAEQYIKTQAGYVREACDRAEQRASRYALENFELHRTCARLEKEIDRLQSEGIFQRAQIAKLEGRVRFYQAGSQPWTDTDPPGKK
jgi:chromosome segregation ATPase